MVKLASVGILFAWVAAVCANAVPRAEQVTIQNTDPNIFYHGRWDSTFETWWASTGFKLNVKNLQTMSLTVGPYTTPGVSIGVSVNYGPYQTVNLTSGTNTIPLGSLPSATSGENTVVRINSWNWQNNRVELESIALNTEASLLPYTPSKLTFQFIGDSLTAGQYLPQGVLQAWPILTGEAFKAETHVIASPGITLTDMQAYENTHGMSVQFFDTEDSGYIYQANHDYLTAWNFTKDVPAPTHVVVYLGANDNGQGVASSTFVTNYVNFIAHLRQVYPTQPMLLLTPWGWPSANGQVGYYYQGDWQTIQSERAAQGDTNIFLVDTTGWVDYQDIQPSNSHPTVAGHVKIAGLFEQWLEQNGIMPDSVWGTPAGSSSGAAPVSSPPVSNPTTSVPVSAPTGGATVAKYGQCGGIGYTGPTVCAAGSTCKESNAYYSQCL